MDFAMHKSRAGKAARDLRKLPNALENPAMTEVKGQTSFSQKDALEADLDGIQVMKRRGTAANWIRG